MYDPTGADLKRKFFKNISVGYLMAKCKQLEAYNAELFFQFMQSGKTMVDAATEGDLEKFK